MQHQQENRRERIRQIKEVLDSFSKNGIRYCLIRNYEFLLSVRYPIESLDTLIAEKDMQKADRILKGLGFSKRTQQFSLKHKAYFKLVNLEKVSFDIQLGGIHWNDMAYLNESVLERRIKKAFYYIPSNNDTFVMLLVHSILGKRYFKKKYQMILCAIADKIDKESAMKELTRIFSKSIAKRLVTAVKKKQFGHIPIYRLIAYFMVKEPSRIIIFTKLFGRWVKWKKPLKPAPLISIIGPDGAGKSSMVEALREILMKNNKQVSVVYAGRGRGQLLPIRKLGNRYKASEKERDKQERPNIFRRKILYSLAAPVFTADLMMRYAAQIFPIRMRKNIVITDRYCTDILLMKYVNYTFKRALLALFPKPTITLFLYNTPEILHSRRPEEPIEELERQLDIYGRIHSDIKIKTNNIKEDHKKAAEEVLRRLLINWD